MNEDNVLEAVRGHLRNNVDEATRDGSHRFFKAGENVRVYGVRMALVSKIAKQTFAAIRDRSKEDIFSLCDELWASGYLEECVVACEWTYALRRQYAPADFAVFERWVDNYVSNWAACDTLCNHTVGAFVEMHPHFVADLKAWCGSENRWKKRAAAVSLIIPARRGLFLSDIFEIADALLSDTDDLVQKGYGWMLKAAGEAYQDEVFDFVTARKKTMPRTAFRYAIEKMPPERRAAAMERQ